MWYNGSTNIVALAVLETPRAVHLVRRCTLDTLPHSAYNGNLNQFYTYTLAYPESMGGTVFYIGKGLGNRIDNHEQYAQRGVRDHKCNAIRKIWRNGEQVIKVKLAHFDTEQEAHLYEIALIFLMRGYGHLANVTDGGEGNVGLVHSEEARHRIGEESKNRKRSERTRQKQIAAAERQWQSEDHHRAMSEAAKQRMQSEEMRLSISSKLKEHPVSDATRRKMSASHKTSPKCIAHLHNLQIANKTFSKGNIPWNKGKGQ
jgi:hypothetical protein